MKFEKDFAGHEFIWFVGVVEARDDPLKLGRVRVRCFGWNPTDKKSCPTDQLPWAGTVQPVTAPPAASSGLTEGTWVFGFFMDGRAAQSPMVMGIIPGYRFDSNNENGESELPRAARMEEDYPSPQSKLRSESRITDIGFDASSGSTWEEPEEPDDKVYPYIQTVSSEAGFITETIFNPNPANPDGFVGPPPRFEARQVTYDCVGGYEERRAPSGDKIIKVIGDNYEIVLGSSFMNVKGDVVMTVEGSLKQNITGDYELNVAGNMSTAVGGAESHYVLGGGTYGFGTGRNTSVLGADVCNIVGSKVETITGPSTRIINGNYTDTVNGTRQFVTVGALTQIASTHVISLGTGSLSSAGTASITTILGLTITGSGTVSGSIVRQGVVTLGAHKHIGVTTGPGISGTPIP
jgi:hypothetical protein